MKRIFSVLILAFSVFSFAQNAVSDTAQVVVSGRKNSVEAQTRPYVIMISADGFRYDYIKKYQAKLLSALVFWSYC